MQKRRLGLTDLEVSVAGLGTVKFGRRTGLKFPEHFSLPTDHEIEHLLSLAKEQGINLLDTAPAYGNSEERLGKLLREKRQDFMISTKVGEEFYAGQSHFDFSKEAIIASAERSLQRLKTDYLDILLVHSNGNDECLIAEENIFATLEELKKAGKIRAYGMSSKTVKGGLLTLEYADVAMVTFNPTDDSEREVINRAEKLNKGILIKKAFASGHLQKIPGSDPVRSALQFILKESAVTSIILGTINPKHLLQNVQSMNEVLASLQERS